MTIVIIGAALSGSECTNVVSATDPGLRDGSLDQRIRWSKMSI